MVHVRSHQMIAKRVGPTLWASGVLTILAGLAWVWIERNRSNLPIPTSDAGRELAETYNILSHGIFLTLLITAVGWMAYNIHRANIIETEHNRLQGNHTRQHSSPGKRLRSGIQKHPFSAGLFALYSSYIIHQSSWFYKEIISWYDDILDGFLLDNFSVRWTFLIETMSRNDYRFFPLAHQDIHILSWFTPYVKIWAIVNCIELVATVVLLVKIVELLSERQHTQSLLAIAGIMFLFTPASAYNYFQFIYSERILVLLFAVFTYNYLRYQQTRRIQNHLGALIASLIGSFTKDTAILLFLVPALAVMGHGLIQQRHLAFRSPKHLWATCRDHFELELNLLGVSIAFLLSFIYLSGLPSSYVGGDRYDAELRFANLQLDPRVLFLLGYSCLRALQIARGRWSFTLLDAINLAAWSYIAALYYLVGFKASNYMALPVQFIAIINLVVAFSDTLAPRLPSRLKTKRLAAGVGIGCSIALVGIEDGLPNNFMHRAHDITAAHASWATTLAAVDTVTEPARINGEEINLIFTKGWFKNNNHLKRLKYDRLIYLNEDTKEITIQDGVDRGKSYVPKPGDFFLNIDTGKRLEKFNIDLSSYSLIYDLDPSISNGKIYRHTGDSPGSKDPE